MRIRYVRQEHRAGCAVACAAMVTGESYKDVARYFAANLTDDGVEWEPIRDYVADRGFSCLEVRPYGHLDAKSSNRRMLRPFADVHIVRVLTAVDSKLGHALVMDKRGKFYDPERPGPVRPDGFYFVTGVLGFFDERKRS